MQGNIKAVIFDMDGLLLDTERLYFQGFRRACRYFGLSDTDHIFPKLIGLNTKNSMDKLQEELGDLVDIRKLDAKWGNENVELFRKPAPVKKGVIELLKILRETHIPYAVATSTRAEKARHHLARTQLRGKFPILVGGDQVERGKPEPDIFLAAAKALKIAPKDCAAFEDSENGVRAALAAGMTTVQIPDIKQPSDEFRELGHLIADDVLAGAQLLKLC